MELHDIISDIRAYAGITRKSDIGRLVEMLGGGREAGNARVVTGFGEDAAAIAHGDHYLLLAAEGMWPRFINAEPYAAGKAAVTASVNDIYAMGGRPLAMVNVLSVANGEQRDLVMDGVRKGCEKLMVPMVGGHLNPDAGEVSLAVAILGTARSLLQSTNARAGQKIVLAVDLNGERGQCKSVTSWDVHSGKTPEYLVERLSLLPYLAEAGLCQTAKDVSNGGIVGTLSLLCEYSGTGALLDLDVIPQPPQMELLGWIKAFLSYGFLLGVEEPSLPACLDAFQQKEITAAVIGEILKDRRMILRYQGAEETLFDFTRESLTGGRHDKS
jgi:hypothetical protein